MTELLSILLTMAAKLTFQKSILSTMMIIVHYGRNG